MQPERVLVIETVFINRKSEEFMSKIKRKTKRYLILGGIAAAVLILVILIVHGVRGMLSPDADTAAGLEYIQEKEAENVSEIENKISLLEQQDGAGGEEGEDTRSLKEKFSTAVVIGDSVTQGFSEFGVLNASSVISRIGLHLYETEDLIAQAKEISPGTVFLALGRNDLASTEGDANEFTDQYTEVLDQIVEELPDANIFVNSIFPVQDKALEDDPYLKDIEQYNEALRELCDSRGIGFIDNTELAEDQYFEEDGQHFTADFYPVWAEHMAEVAAL